MLVVLSHTLRMEFTVQLFNRRSMYCVDMFPKIMLQGGGGGVPWTLGVDFAAPLLLHVNRVDWVEVLQ